MSEKIFKNDLFGTFRHASYSVQKNEPNGPFEPPPTTYPSTPLMGAPSKDDKTNLKDYPLTPDKSTGGKSHGSYNLVESNKDPKKKMSNGLKCLLASLCVFLLILLMLVGAWLALYLGGDDCKGSDCNVTIQHTNDTNLLIASHGWSTEIMEPEILPPSVNGGDSVLNFDNCTDKYTHEDIINYEIYIKSNNKTFSDNKSKCKSLDRFLTSMSQIGSLNKKFKPHAEFGLTVFTDWTESKRTEIGTGSTSSNDFEEKSVRIDKPAKGATVNFLENTYNVAFNDNCSPKLNMKKALKTISENIVKGITSKQPNNSDNPDDCGNDEKIYQIALNTEDEEIDRNIFTNWLLTRGPFATNLIVPDSFFDYKNGTFSADMCAKDFATMIYVLVVGNGERFDPLTNSNVQFWHIMPIGEIWKKWGNGGYMRLDVNACIPPQRNSKLIALLD